MRLICWAIGALASMCQLTQVIGAAIPGPGLQKRKDESNMLPSPRIFIVSMFASEADIWYRRLPTSGLGNLFGHNISAPGLSMIYPRVHCIADYSICQVTTGEAEINAAATITAVVLSGKFDLTKTYWLAGGIAGVNPKQGTLGSVALARYAVQVALQYELDAREMPDNFTTGYFPFGTFLPGQYPTIIYGTEVFELNAALRDTAYTFALNASLTDDEAGAKYRAKYAGTGAAYIPAIQKPSVIKCDTATSDVYYSGARLGEAFENTTRVWTNGTGEYCMTAQEDNAVLAVLVRMAIEGLVDFSRVIVLRSGADFDRPPPGVSPYEHLRVLDQNGFDIAVNNNYYAGVEIARGILRKWDCTFAAGVKPTNYIGDIFGSLGGEPDFGPGSITEGKGFLPKGASDVLKRGLKGSLVDGKMKGTNKGAQAV